jgi:outer membrane protein assembly factor BamB
MRWFQRALACGAVVTAATLALPVAPGTATARVTTKTTLTSSAASAKQDAFVTFTARVTSAGHGTVTGLVSFTDSSNGSPLAIVKLANGVAKLTTAALAPGTRKIVARYTGSSKFGASAAAARRVTVAATSEAVTYQIDPAHDGRQVSGVLRTASLHKKWSVTLGAKDSSGAAEAGDVSYPIIAGGLVFVTVENASGHGSVLYALRAGTGAKAWSVHLPGTFGFSALAYGGRRLFALNDNGVLTEFVASTGQEVASGQLPGQSDFSAPPTVYDGVIYAMGAGSGGTLYAITQADGLGRWRASVENGDKSAPAVDNSGVYVSFAGQQDYRFSLSGKHRWHHNTGIEGGGGSTAVLHGNDVYARGAHDSPLILAESTGRSVGSFASDTAPAFGAKDMFTLSDGHLVAVGTSGSPDRWTFGNGTLVTAPVVSGGTVFVGSSGGTVYGVSAATGKRIWSSSAGSRILGPDEQNADVLAGLAVGNGLLVVPAGRSLTAFAG